MLKQRIQLKKQQPQTSLGSQPLNPISSNSMLGTSSQFMSLRNRENTMRIEDQTMNDENDERKLKHSFMDRRYGH